MRQSEFLPLVDDRLKGMRGKIALALEVERPLTKKELWGMIYNLNSAAKIIHDALTSNVTKKGKQNGQKN